LGELVAAEVRDLDVKGRTLRVDGKTGQRTITLIEFTCLSQRAAMPTLSTAVNDQANPVKYVVEQLVANHYVPLDELAETLNKDATLSDVGRAQKLAPQVTATKAATEGVAAGFAESLAELETRRAKYYVPPPVEKGEEIRLRFEAMTDVRKGELLASISKGENDDALHALVADSLLSDRYKKLVDAVWSQRVQRTHAPELARLEVFADAYKTGQAALGGLAPVLTKAAPVLPRQPRPTEDLTHMNEEA
jgi:hypothetical protein